LFQAPSIISLPHLPCQPLPQRRRRLRVHDLIDDLTVPEDRQRGDAQHAVAARSARVLIRVKLTHHRLARNSPVSSATAGGNLILAVKAL
jgi:hypothetical protein